MKIALIVIVFILPTISALTFDLRDTIRLHRKIQKITNPEAILPNGVNVIGKENITRSQNKRYFTFKGIPYAEPPLGDLRFRAPVPKKVFLHNVINATSNQPPCVQPALRNKLSPAVGNEDCLYLNVFVPAKYSPLPLPVIIWIHGGFFLIGDAADYEPDYFLEQNVIIVTFNYRLGAFGFLSTGDSASPGNYGLKDQEMVIRWVNENIAAFGGDKSSVTLMGGSSGAVSIGYLSQKISLKGLFHRAILQSGSNLCTWGYLPNAAHLPRLMAVMLGIFSKNNTYIVSKLRTINYLKVQYASLLVDASDIVVGNLLGSLPFGPSIEPESPEAIVTKPMHEMYRLGEFIRIPYLIGFTSEESSPFMAAILQYAREMLLKYDFFPIKLIPNSLNLNASRSKLLEVAKKLHTHYFNQSYILFSKNASVQYTTDSLFMRPIVEHIKLLSTFTPVYAYNFSFNEIIPEAFRVGSGVGHSEEMFYLWYMEHDFDNVTRYSPSQVLMNRRFVRMWINFVKTSNPTPIKDALLQNVAWPVARASNSYNFPLLNIGNDLVVENFTHPHLAFWHEIFNDYGQPPFTSY